MRIEAVGQTALHTAQRPLPSSHSAREAKPQTVALESSIQTLASPPVQLTTDITAPTAPEAPDLTAPDTQPATPDKGVLRLLESGHFKGVADVRLRINFFEELSARAAVRVGEALSTQSATLISTMDAKLDELIAPLATDEALREQLDAAVAEFEAAVDSATSAQTAALNQDGLAAALQSAFETLVTQLQELFAPSAVEPPVTEEPVEEPPAGEAPPEPVGEIPTAEPPLTAGAVPVEDALDGRTLATAESAPLDAPVTTVEPTAEPVADAAAPIDDAITALSEAFAAALADLLDSISLESQLPPLSAPSGNGTAYDKFLATYNDLLHPQTVDELA